MYFKKFPKIKYDVNGDGRTIEMTNLTKRVKLLDYSLKNLVSFDYYDVRDNETPEGIAYTYYGDANKHWLVLLANDIVDFYSDWPMSVTQFESYVHSKYDDVNEVHHYEAPQGSGSDKIYIEYPNDPATTLPSDAIAVTNYEYEERIQTEKRRIRLIRPQYVGKIQTEFENKMRE
jgi:hypothetical protein